jgi:Flp pilus assembly protein TadD
MRNSALALLLIMTCGPILGGCSGLRPFWWDSHAGKQAAERSIEGPLTLARLAEQRGKQVEAERLYRSILERNPDHPVIHHRLAIMQSRKGRFEEANVYFDRALQLKPDDPTLICDAGYCQYLQDRLDMAEALFRQALEIDPHHEAALNNLALVLGERGDDKEAFALFRQNGTEARAHTNMGFVYTRRGEIEKAKTAFSRALSLDPQMIVAGEALVQLAHLEKDAKATVAQAVHSGTDRSNDIITSGSKNETLPHNSRLASITKCRWCAGPM